MTWLALGLVVASALVFAPFAPWVMLAMWMALFARRFQRPLARKLGNRPKLAASLTLIWLAMFLVPVLVMLGVLVLDAIDLLQDVASSARGKQLLAQLASGRDVTRRPAEGLMQLAMTQGGRAWELGQQILGTATNIVIGLVILIGGAYAMLLEGDRWYAWVERNAPIPPEAVRRFGAAFIETGRGLFIGMLGAGLAQAIVATIVYLALQVPQAFALGFLTLVCSVLPAVGTAIVWIPVAAGLALTGRTGAAGLLMLAGFALIGTIDNLARPYLARRGRLELPTYVVLVAMFGGVFTFGAWGVLVAPLIVRLAKEAILIVHEQRSPIRAPIGGGTDAGVSSE